MEQNKTVYKSFTTYDFRTSFSQIVRDIHNGKFDAAIITSYGRNIGVFLPHPDAEK